MRASPMRLALRPLENAPVYELRVSGITLTEVEVSIWQLPSPATPRLQFAERTACLTGRPWRMVEARITKRLRNVGINIASVRKGQSVSFAIDEDFALNVALLFRVLAPMRSIDRIRLVADGVDRMTREEAGYWLGMAVHRVYPRRVLAALRLLLTTP